MKIKSKKRILFIVNHDWFFTSHRLPIAIDCLKNNYEVHLGSNFSESKNVYLKHGIKTHQINISRTSINPLKSFFELINVIKLFIHIKPEIVHLISHKPMIYGSIASLFFRELKIVASVSGLGFVFSHNGFQSFVIRKLIIFLYKLCFYKKRIKIIFQNTFDKEYFKRILNLQEKEIILIPGSGVNISEYQFKPLPKGKPIILFASRLIYSKGLNEFVKASNLFKNARFVIVGKIDSESKDSITKSQLNNWTRNNNIEYWGFSKNIKEIIYKSTLVVLPSYYGEGLPKILIEAAACGRPVITTYNHGCLAAIDNYETGLAVPIKDYLSLFSAINFLLKNPILLANMSINGRKRAEKLFNITKVVDTHIDIYKSL